MEDYLKDKISEYKPVFKEEYWHDVSSQLKKRRRRRLLLIWWSGTLGGLAIAALIYIGWNGQMSAEDVNKQAGEFQKSIIEAVTSASSAELSQSTHELNSKPAQENGQSQSGKSHVINDDFSPIIKKNNTTQSISAIPSQISAETIDQRSDTKKTPGNMEESITTIKQSLQDTQDAPDMKSSNSDTHQIEKIKSDLAETILGENNLETTGVSYEQKKTSNNLSHTSGNTIVSPIDLLVLSLFNIEAEVFSLKAVKRVNVSVSNQRYSIRPMSVSFLAAALNNPVHGFVHNEEIRIQRSYNFRNQPFSIQFGLGAGRYTGELSATDHATVTYRSFASNSLSQTLIPKAAYYVNLPIQFRWQANRWNLGLSISPEYLVALRGSVISKEITTTVTAHEVITLASSYEIEQIAVISKKSAWLDQSNIKPISLPIGLSIEYRLGEHWGIGAAAHIYTSGLYSFKRRVLNQTAVAGNPEQLKGGLHVSYKF